MMTAGPKKPFILASTIDNLECIMSYRYFNVAKRTWDKSVVFNTLRSYVNGAPYWLHDANTLQGPPCYEYVICGINPPNNACEFGLPVNLTIVTNIPPEDELALKDLIERMFQWMAQWIGNHIQKSLNDKSMPHKNLAAWRQQEEMDSTRPGGSTNTKYPRGRAARCSPPPSLSK